MSNGQDIAIRHYEGPSLAAPFAAVVAEFRDPFGTTLAPDRIRALLNEDFQARGLLTRAIRDEEADFPALAANLSVFWQDFDLPLRLPCSVARLGDGAARIAVGYFDADKGIRAVRAGTAFAHAIFARAANPSADVTAALMLRKHAAELAHSRKYGTVTFAYLTAARARGIPVYEMFPDRNFLVYGQGSRSRQFVETTSNLDSVLGHRFCKDKFVSNMFVKRLGFPGVEHGVAAALSTARAVAARLGGTLVVKPSDRNGATGVSVGIESVGELEAAFALAQPLSESGTVLVERFVPGDDHRLSVFNKKLYRAIRLLPALVECDGVQSIAQIIDADNVRRRAAIDAGDYVHELRISDMMRAVLRRQGLGLRDIPEAGRIVRLANTSNVKTGGTRENLTASIHPDNRLMAETIAENLCLDAVGIDFITPDISKSWRETPCAIIEINSNPGIGNELGTELMRDMFPREEDARIASVLVVGSVSIADNVSRRFRDGGLRVGLTSRSSTSVDGVERFGSEAGLPRRILGILLDRTCDALVVAASTDDIASHGVPHTRFDLAILADEGISSAMRDLVRSCSIACVDQTAGEASGEARNQIEALILRMTPAPAPTGN